MCNVHGLNENENIFLKIHKNSKIVVIFVYFVIVIEIVIVLFVVAGSLFHLRVCTCNIFTLVFYLKNSNTFF